jgi:putative MATE family efflux protein
MKGLGLDKGTYKMMAAMAWPIMVEEGLQTAVSYVDTAMVGALGAGASAAVGITQTATWLIWGLLRAAGVGLIACVAQAMGAQDMQRVRRAGGQAVLVALIMGVVVGGASLLCATRVPVWMGVDPAIQREAGQYFFILCLPMIFRAATINLGAVIRGTGDMRTPMLVNLVVNAVNIILNFLLIYPSRDMGFFGRPIHMWGAGLGVVGAAWASAIAVALGGVLMTVALWRNPWLSPGKANLRFDREIQRFNIRIAIPAALQHVVICLGFVVFVALAARLGTVPLAAHTIANTAEQAFYIPAYGLQGVAVTMVGMALGAGDNAKAHRLARMLAATAAGLMVILGGLLFAFPEALMGLFTPDAAVIAQGSIALRIVAVAEPFFGAMTVAEGVLRGAGNLKPSLYISLVCVWGVRVLGTWVCLTFWHMGLASVWVCMSLDNLCRFGCYTWLIETGRWRGRAKSPEKTGETPANNA